MEEKILKQIKNLIRTKGEIKTYALITNKSITAIGKEDELLALLATYIKELKKNTSESRIIDAIIVGLMN